MSEPDTNAGYLRDCPALSEELAELAEQSDDRPLLRDERQRLAAAIYACAIEIRMRRPAIVHARLEGRVERGQ